MERTLLTIAALALAYLVDYLFGDPPWLPHPVRLIGRLIGLLEGSARKIFKSDHGLKLAGLIIVLLVAAGSALAVYFSLAAAYRFNPAAGFLFELYIYYAVLAGGDLRNHLLAVLAALREDNLEEGRNKVALLVSRDTQALDSGELSRAALESLFENSSDGLVAPLFFAALFGPAAAVLYKAVSTLDSMIGYKNKSYAALGFTAARLDDLLNCLPARLTALLILIAGSGRKNSSAAWRVLVADRDKHESPNSAWPEAAAAGVLNVRLGGAAVYQGRVTKRPEINAAGQEAGPEVIAAGISLFQNTSLLAFLLLLALACGLMLLEVGKF
jgi:adenosylcobinamide-phosphate synthase